MIVSAQAATPFSLSIFYYLLPIAALLYHRQLPLVCHKAEFRFFFVLKIIAYIIYIIIISYAAA